MKKDHVQEIKDRLAIQDVVSSYIKIEKAGSNFKARCPFHNEKTPSFFLSPDRGTYYCFGCGEKGDIFSFVEKFEGLDFKGALKVLALKAGVELEPLSASVRDDKERLYKIVEDAAIFFEQELEKNPEAKAYIAGRGIKEKTVSSMRIGYAPAEWRKLRSHLSAKNYSDQEMLAVGLIKKTDKKTDDPYYDVFRGRVMFPIADSSGRMVAFSGRIVVDDGKSPKYLNSPETVLFSKSKILYGLDKAKQAIRTRNYAILVEGQMDLVMSHQAGFTNTVAVSGTAFSEDQEGASGAVSGIGLVTRMSKNLIIAFDSDDAGYKATLRAGKIALGMGMDVKVAHIIGGKDPADIIKANPSGWAEIIKNSTPLVPFIFSRIKATTVDSKKIGVLVRTEVLPYIAIHESSIEQARLVEYISGETGIKSEALWSDLSKISLESGGAAHFQKALVQKDFSRLEQIERKIFGILNLYKNKEALLSLPVSRIREIVGEKTFIWYESLPPTEISAMATPIEVMYGAKGVMQKDLDELVLSLEKEHVKRKREEVGSRIKRAQAEKDSERENALLKEHHALSKKIDEIDIRLTQK